MVCKVCEVCEVLEVGGCEEVGYCYGGRLLLCVNVYCTITKCAWYAKYAKYAKY